MAAEQVDWQEYKDLDSRLSGDSMVCGCNQLYMQDSRRASSSALAHAALPASGLGAGA